MKNVIGKYVTLIEKPNGYLSKDYQVKVGQSYKIKDIVECCYLIEINKKETGIINKDRFKLN